MEREARVTAVIGVPGCGKTDFITGLAKKTKPDKVLIVDKGMQEPKWLRYKEINGASADAMRTFKGWARTDIRGYRKGDPNVWDNIYYQMRNGYVFFDDCRTYIPKAVPDEIEQVFSRRRQHGNDLFLVVHGFNSIPPKLYQYITHYVLFLTTDSLDNRKEYISGYYDKLVKIKDNINQKAQKNKHYHEIIEVKKLYMVQG